MAAVSDHDDQDREEPQAIHAKIQSHLFHAQTININVSNEVSPDGSRPSSESQGREQSRRRTLPANRRATTVHTYCKKAFQVPQFKLY